MNALVKNATHHILYGETDIELLNLKLAEYDVINSIYVGEYIFEELNKRMPDMMFDRSIIDEEARKEWDALPDSTRQAFLNDLYCFKCSSHDTEFTKILDNKITYELQGICKQCDKSVKTQIYKNSLYDHNNQIHYQSSIDKWNALPVHIKESLINNVFCGTCGISSIVDYEVNNEAHGISLEGKCKMCGNDIARYVEL